MHQYYHYHSPLLNWSPWWLVMVWCIYCAMILALITQESEK